MGWRCNLGRRAPAAGLALVLTAAPYGAVACGRACAGQCGAPYQLQVVFRPGTARSAAMAAMTSCATGPLVVRIGRVLPAAGSPGGEPPGSLTATILTRSMSPGPFTDRLLKCLRGSRSVLQAGYPD
jgi:hypothetical protein